MALSIGRMGATTSYSQIRPQSYALSNESQTSAAYEAPRHRVCRGSEPLIRYSIRMHRPAERACQAYLLRRR